MRVHPVPDPPNVSFTVSAEVIAGNSNPVGFPTGDNFLDCIASHSFVHGEKFKSFHSFSKFFCHTAVPHYKSGFLLAVLCSFLISTGFGFHLFIFWGLFATSIFYCSYFDLSAFRFDRLWRIITPTHVIHMLLSIFQLVLFTCTSKSWQ